MGLETKIFDKKSFDNIGMEKTEIVKDGGTIYKKNGRVYLVKEMNSPTTNDKVYYVSPLREEKNGQMPKV